MLSTQEMTRMNTRRELQGGRDGVFSTSGLKWSEAAGASVTWRRGPGEEKGFNHVTLGKRLACRLPHLKRKKVDLADL